MFSNCCMHICYLSHIQKFGRSMWSFSMTKSERKRSKPKAIAIIASLNCSERAEFDDDSAVSLATTGSKY